MILLDTVVLSEIRKSRPSPKLMTWLKAQREDHLYLSVISLGEIARGIEKVKKTDAEFAQTLAQWLDTLQRLYADRILPITPPIARLWGERSAQLGHDGADVLIAATAQVHRLRVATRNVKHFKHMSVEVLDPFTG